jgi:DNA-binding GntR family transcriptional regulator
LEKKLSPTIDVTNINEKIYEWLKKRIISCIYPPGHKLNVRQLRKDLGVSQTPIKDALFRLAGEGLIEISSRKGTYVKEVTDQDIAEIYDTRLILESGAGEVIATEITDEQIKELERLYEATLRTDATPITVG